MIPESTHRRAGDEDNWSSGGAVVQRAVRQAVGDMELAMRWRIRGLEVARKALTDHVAPA